jgi:hypothetical protein
MRRFRSFLMMALALVAPLGRADEPKEWAMNATIIEACTCPMFCQCFFNEKVAGHHDHATGQMKHYCKGNLAFKVNSGYHGTTDLGGAKFWLAGDLGERLTDGMEWGVVTFDPAVKPEQRQAIGMILSHVYPFPVKDMKTGKDATIEWRVNKDRAIAMLDSGKAGEIVLKRFQGMSDEPIVVRNLKYIGAPRNDGFLLMPNEVQAWRLGDQAFESKNTNGFVVTIDISSKDVMPKPAG